MPSRSWDPRGPRLPSTIAVAVTLLALAGCGSSATAPPTQPRPSAPVAEFPSAAGKTLAQIDAGHPEGPILAPSVTILGTGPNRFGFALFDASRRFVTNAGTVLYVSRPDGTHVAGPYPARIESLAVRPAFESKTTSQDPAAAKQVYVSTLPFRKNGKYVLTALSKIDGKTMRSNPYGVTVGGDPRTQPPAVGDRAIRVHTPTLDGSGGNAAAIDTRVPPAKDLLQSDLWNVLGQKPVVLMFATPRLCQSRVCGPVVDVEEQVANQMAGKAVFIHNEIYRDNEIAKGLRPQPSAYRLPSEPWTFVIDRRGIIRTRFEGAFSTGELERAVAQADGPTA
jgi:hypothetical protein